jgi:uncharacterized membrane protein
MTLSQSPGNQRDSKTFPVQVTLSCFAAAFFTMALACDLAYVQTTILMWKDFASWLVFAGMIVAGLAVLFWVIGQAVYRVRPNWVVVVLNAIVLVVAFVNNLFHAGDGWTAIVPWGVGLSLVTVFLMLVSATISRQALDRVYF